VRSTNTGVSAVVLPDGELSVRSGLFEPVALNFNLALYPPKWTLMKFFGDWFKIFCVCISVGLSALLLRNRFTQVSKT
jgi:apolipoprotein N-acyltransferase